jgi:hypothetical protein
VSGLLALVGVDADPLSSREHILLSNLIHHSWSEGRSLDLPTLVGMVGNPPIRKLGVFELDQFFPAKERMALAMQLNGLLASPSFAAWAQGPPIDISSMLYTADGRGRCAIVTTAHLSDDERQFVTSLVLGKLVTWMRRQSGTTGLRALRVHGRGRRLPAPDGESADQEADHDADEAGAGVRRRNRAQHAEPGRHRLQGVVQRRHVDDRPTVRPSATRRDCSRGSSAAGEVDISPSSDTISGLGKRQFVLRTPGSRTRPRSSPPAGR